jgi:beta-lactamase class A
MWNSPVTRTKRATHARITDLTDLAAMLRLATTCALVAAGACRYQPATAATTSGLRDQIQARIARSPGALVGVAYVDLAAGDTLFINADSLMHAASTMKVPVMMRLFRESDAGHLSLDQRILVVNRFTSIVDGSPYVQDPGVDSDSAMYKLVGDSVTIRDLIQHMITRSSNLATNTLIALANPDSVNAMMRSMGANRMIVLRGVEDEKAFEKGLNNMATARDLAILLRDIETGKAASPASTDAMRDILLAQQFNDKIPAGLPPGTRVAHKTGDITAIAHDAAIVYPANRKPYILVVLTKGIADEKVANTLIADVSRIVYQHAMATR